MLAATSLFDDSERVGYNHPLAVRDQPRCFPRLATPFSSPHCRQLASINLTRIQPRKGDVAMSDFLTEIASKAGLDSEQAHQGVGVLLTTLKNRLDPAAFSHIRGAIPDSEDMLSAIETKMQAGTGGLLDVVKNITGKLVGGKQDARASLESTFASVGLSPEHLKSLLPQLHEMLANKLPPHVMDQIKEHVPGFGPATE
jgi:hypothetical protein